MKPQHVDVLVVGAGLSGIGAGYHLQTKCPNKTYLILEGRANMGGTWDLFRYPGIRSDSDMFTFGYSFRPWNSQKSITQGEFILKYIQDTAREFGIDQHICLNHRVCGANWSSQDALWTVDVVIGDERTPARFTCNFLYLCTGYYDYDRGHMPTWDGIAAYQGEIIHPQRWPDDVDYTDKRVVVIGSGATAVTLVPALAQKAERVTMLQRSPTYVVSRPSESVMAKHFYRWLPAKTAHSLSRWHSILFQMYNFTLARRFPEQFKQGVMDMVREELGDDYDVETHFNPRYNPWDERLCLVPDSDFFKAIKAGKAAVVTDHIERFTETGIRLQSGEQLPADIVITATGLRLQLASGMELHIDDTPVDLGQHLIYKGVTISDVPNMAYSIGYTNASWTLKSELISGYVCRLLNHMDKHGYDYCLPTDWGSSGREDEGRPVLDFTSGYIQRGLAMLPKQGEKRPWVANQNYLRDLLDIRLARLEDGVMTFHKCRVIRHDV